MILAKITNNQKTNNKKGIKKLALTTVNEAINSTKLRYVDVPRRIYTMIMVLVLAVTGAKAQYDVSFSHYYDLEPTFNPASVGKQHKLNITAAYAMDLAGFEHNPQTMYIGADLPFYFLTSYHGGGLSIMSDKIGLFTHQRVAAQYSYKLRLFGGTLGIGVQGGFLSEVFNGSELDVQDTGDQALATSEVKGNALDLGAGLYYTHGRWYVGASVQHLNSPLVELGETNELQIDKTYYLTGGYNIKLRNPFLTIHPSVLFKTDGVGWRADVTGRLMYTNDTKKMYGGISYSPTNSVTFLIGGFFHGIHAGYSYEVYTSAVNPGNGSHELFVGYQVDLNFVKRGKNKHKSVRLL